MSPVRPLLAAVAVALLALTGCSGSSPKGGGTEAGVEVTAKPTPSSARPGGTTATITISGSKISTSSQRVKARVNQPVTLLITSDRAGELHVHSSPEQHVSFPKGTSAAQITLEQPGVVDVEDHALDELILQLEVR